MYWKYSNKYLFSMIWIELSRVNSECEISRRLFSTSDATIFFNIQCWNTWLDYMNNRNHSWLGDWIILIVALCPRPHIPWEWDFILVFWLNSDLDIIVTFGSHLLCGILMVFLCVYPHRSCIRIYFTTCCLTSPWSYILH